MDTERYATEAKPAAEEFIGLIDEGRYYVALDKVLLRFPSDLTIRRRIGALIEDRRKPFGMVFERKYYGVTYRTTVPGMPDGKYLIMGYKTKFENKEYAFERVTLKYENNNWKVIDYAIR